MSLKIRKSIIMKASIPDYKLLMFIRNKLPFGKCVLYTKNGLPARVEKAVISELFDDNDMGLDFSQEEKAGNSS